MMILFLFLLFSLSVSVISSSINSISNPRKDSDDELFFVNSMNASEGVKEFHALYVAVLTEHLKEFSGRPASSAFNTEFYQNFQRIEEYFMTAIKFSTGVSTDFIIGHREFGIPVHCFLLEYFLQIFQTTALDKMNYMDFLTIYADKLEHLILESKTSEIVMIVQNYIIPLIFKLVMTGNFLIYSKLLSISISQFSENQKAKLYQLHFKQYFYDCFIIRELDFEVFLFGLEFLDMYVPRLEILSISGLDSRFAVTKPKEFFTIAYHPIKSVTNSSFDLDSITDDDILLIKNSNIFDNCDIDVAFSLLDTFLSETNYLQYSTDKEFHARKSIFNAVFNICDDSIILKAINLQLIALFTAWIHFNHSNIDLWSKEAVKLACLNSYIYEFKRFYYLMDNLN